MTRTRFEDVAEQAGPRVARYLLSRGASPQDAADILQETLVVAWRRSDSLPGSDADAVAWLIGIARRTQANHRRAGLARTAATQRLAEQIRLDAERAERTDLHEVLSRIAPDHREALTLTYWEGLSTDQLAVAMGIRPTAARKRLQRAREALRCELAAGRTGPAPKAAPNQASMVAIHRC